MSFVISQSTSGAMMMEERDFLPAALKALEPRWTEIASALTSHEDPLFSDAAEQTFDKLRARIVQSEQEAEAERYCRAFVRIARDAHSDSLWRF